MKWPAKSPDLSWIENMWAIVSSRVQRRANLNIDNFEQAIHEDEWASIPQSTYMPVFNSTRRRKQECINKEGGVTHY